MASYQPLGQFSSTKFYVPFEASTAWSTRILQSWRLYALILTLVITNIVTLIWHQQPWHSQSLPDGFARVRDFSPTWEHFWWDTAYSSPNRTLSDALWNSILPSHGIVAVDRQWAAEQHWPVSMYLPDDHSKGVYLLEAYHQLHCLRILRQTLFEALEDRPFTYHVGTHMEHCFDTLRQSVQCNADNTPLYTFGDFTAGDGQLHQCRNWNELKEWATEHTACYRDSVEPIPLAEHFGHCDDGDDGIGTIDEGVTVP